MESLFVMSGLLLIGTIAYLYVVYSDKKQKAH